MLTHWWLGSQPGIPGWVRLVFYGGLLVLCLIDHPSPLDAPNLLERTERRLYTPAAALRALGLSWIDPPVLRVVRALTVVAWIAAAAGLVQPVSAIAVFAGFALLHAANWGALGSNHSTHAALYALFCMTFSVSYDGPTADRLLAEHLSWPLLVPPGSVLESGFAPRLLLVALVFVLFAAGISKLVNGGGRWLDGKALRYYIAQSASAARFPALARVLAAQPALCRALAVTTVIVELSAPIALFVGPGYRVVFVLLWSGLHLGILAVMMPAYWVQMWCYLLTLDWYAIGSAVTRHPLQPAPLPLTGGPAAIALTAFGFAFSAVLAVVLVRQIEEWPFTSVPMYSNGVPPEDLVLPSREHLHGRATRARRGRHSAWHRAWVGDEIQVDVTLVPRDAGGEAIALFEALSRRRVRLVRWAQYTKVVRSVAIAEIASKPADRPDQITAGSPADHFLTGLATIVRDGLPEWERYGALELTCKTAHGWLVIARTDITATTSRPLDQRR